MRLSGGGVEHGRRRAVKLMNKVFHHGDYDGTLFILTTNSTPHMAPARAVFGAI